MKFGVAGNSLSFFAEGNKTTFQAGAWCANRGIDFFEYSFGRGINVQKATAESIGSEFKARGVEMSVHAPYFINFSNPSPEAIEKSIGYVMTSLRKVSQFGGKRVVFHPAAQGKASREEAHAAAVKNIGLLAEVIADSEYNDYIVCPETMGKKGQMGTVDEIIDYCKLSPCFYPCIDFGHINAREQGILKSGEYYNTIIEKLLENLPKHKINGMHVHFSKIQYGASGEIRHLTFEDEIYGPDYEPMIDAMVKYGLNPYIVCESDGTQAEDTLRMKTYYKSIIN